MGRASGREIRRVDISEALEERILAQTEDVDGHRLWTGCVDLRGGEGRIGAGKLGTSVPVTRLAWVLEHGTLPAGMMVRSACGDRRCLAHLVIEPGRKA